MNKQRIGILGGTFDPIHIGHLRLALDVLQFANLHHVRLVPCHRPPHRADAIANISHRSAMISLAITNEPTLTLDKRETLLPAPSYTINTLISLQHDFPEASFYLIVGSDAFNQFTTWHQFEKIMDYCHIVVAKRPSAGKKIPAPLCQFMASDINELLSTPCGKIITYDMIALEISATRLREQFFSGKNPRYLITDNVYDYIKQNKLYRQKG